MKEFLFRNPLIWCNWCYFLRFFWVLLIAIYDVSYRVKSFPIWLSIASCFSGFLNFCNNLDRYFAGNFIINELWDWYISFVQSKSLPDFNASLSSLLIINPNFPYGPVKYDCNCLYSDGPNSSKFFASKTTCLVL